MAVGPIKEANTPAPIPRLNECQPVKPRVYPVEPRFDPVHSRVGLLGMAFQTSQATRSFTRTISTNENTPVIASRVVSVLIPYSEL